MKRDNEFNRRLLGKTPGITWVICVAALSLLISAALVPAQTSQVTETSQQPDRYRIQLKLDFDSLSYSGSEVVTWINRDDRPASTLYFHLYPNLRPDDSPGGSGLTTVEAEEPRLQITEVRNPANNNAPLPYSIDERGTILRITLPEPLAPGKSTQISIGFKGTVPEVDPEETGLTTHVVKQVSAALRGERETRRPRDLNFRCRGVMLLGTAYPVLAVNRSGEWLRKTELTVGDVVFNEVADYEVTIEAAPGVIVFTSAPQQSASEETTKTFSAAGLRDFAIVAGRNLRSEEVRVGDLTLRSIYLPEHERVGKRVLAMSEDALKIFQDKFGPLPFKSLNMVEAPLVAGLGSTEFAGFDVIASAYYVDFDSPAMRNLPEIIREQRPSVEESLEWSVAHLVAHQWWGAAVGNDPAREPVLDEAMASWSALLYFKERHGEQKAAAIMRDQLHGVYRLYRTFGGPDMNANHASRVYRNSFQYAALVTTKGALMLVQLEKLLGRDKLLAALQRYYKGNQSKIADVNALREELSADAPIEQKRAVVRTFNRWLASRRGDEDIARPDAELAESLGLPTKKPAAQGGNGNPLGAVGRVGKFFWQQMTRIR